MSEDRVRAAFRDQAGHCRDLGSPFMARLMNLCARRLDATTAVGALVLDWPGDPATSADSVPLRLAAGLHALKLQGRALARVYPPQDVPDDALWSAVENALEAFGDELLAWLDSPPQTNEVRRAAAILPALAEIGARTGLPVGLLELGASAGLNLACADFRLDTPGGPLGDPTSPVRLSPEWSGPPPTLELPEVIERRGVDLAPVDATTEPGRLRLLACLWPDQPNRIARTAAAIELIERDPPTLDRADAGAWLDAVLPARPEGAVTVIFHTIAWQYFPPATAARARTAIALAAATAGQSAPLAHLSVEADGGRGAAIDLTLWPPGETRRIGRLDFHGRWIAWQGLPDTP